MYTRYSIGCHGEGGAGEIANANAADPTRSGPSNTLAQTMAFASGL